MRAWLGWSKRRAARKIQAIAVGEEDVEATRTAVDGVLPRVRHHQVAVWNIKSSSYFRSFTNRNQQLESKQALLCIISDFNNLASYIAKALSEGDVNCYYDVFGRLVVTTRSKRTAICSLCANGSDDARCDDVPVVLAGGHAE